MMSRYDWKLALSVGMNTMNDTSLSALAEAGIYELELSAARSVSFFDYPTQARAYSALAKKHGITISSIHLPFADCSPATQDPDFREDVIKMQSILLRSAADAGVSIAVIHPSREPYKEEERAFRMQIAIETIGCLTDIAKSCDITLALENLPRTCLCRSSHEMRRFLDEIPDLRVCFDTNHTLMEDNLDYLRAVGDRLVTLHVSDYDRIDEKHWLPMEGVNDWGAILSTLEALNYQGRFLYETKEKTPLLIRQNFDRLLTL